MSEERYCNNCKQQVVPQRPKVKGIGGGGFAVLIGAVAIGVGVTNIVDPLGVGHRDTFLLITGAAVLVLVTLLNVWVASMKSHCPICHTKKGMQRTISPWDWVRVSLGCVFAALFVAMVLSEVKGRPSLILGIPTAVVGLVYGGLTVRTLIAHWRTEHAERDDKQR